MVHLFNNNSNEKKTIKLVRKLQEEANEEWEKELAQRRKQELNDEAIAKELQAQLELEERNSSTSNVQSNPLKAISSPPPPLPNKPREYYASSSSALNTPSNGSSSTRVSSPGISPLYGLSSSTTGSNNSYPTLPPRKNTPINKKPVNVMSSSPAIQNTSKQSSRLSELTIPNNNSSLSENSTTPILPRPVTPLQKIPTHMAMPEPVDVYNNNSAPSFYQQQSYNNPTSESDISSLTQQSYISHTPPPPQQHPQPQPQEPRPYFNNSSVSISAPVIPVTTPTHFKMNNTSNNITPPAYGQSQSGYPHYHPQTQPQHHDPISLPLTTNIISQNASYNHSDSHLYTNQQTAYPTATTAQYSNASLPIQHQSSYFNTHSRETSYSHLPVLEQNAPVQHPTTFTQAEPYTGSNSDSHTLAQHSTPTLPSDHSFTSNSIADILGAAAFKHSTTPTIITPKKETNPYKVTAVEAQREDKGKQPMYTDDLINFKPDECPESPQQNMYRSTENDDDDEDDEDDWNDFVAIRKFSKRAPTPPVTKKTYTAKMIEEYDSGSGSEGESGEDDEYEDVAVDPFNDDFDIKASLKHNENNSTTSDNSSSNKEPIVAVQSSTTIKKKEKSPSMPKSTLQIVDPLLQRKFSTNKTQEDNEARQYVEKLSNDIEPLYHQSTPSMSSMGDFSTPIQSSTNVVYQQQPPRQQFMSGGRVIEEDMESVASSVVEQVFPTNILRAGRPIETQTTPYNSHTGAMESVTPHVYHNNASFTTSTPYLYNNPATTAVASTPKPQIVPATDYGYFMHEETEAKKTLPRLPTNNTTDNTSDDRHITVASIDPGRRAWIKINPADTGKMLAERIAIIASYQTRRVTQITTRSGRDIPLNNSGLFDSWSDIHNFQEGEMWSVRWVPIDSGTDIISEGLGFMKQLKDVFKGNN